MQLTVPTLLVPSDTVAHAVAPTPLEGLVDAVAVDPSQQDVESVPDNFAEVLANMMLPQPTRDTEMQQVDVDIEPLPVQRESLVNSTVAPWLLPVQTVVPTEGLPTDGSADSAIDFGAPVVQTTDPTVVPAKTQDAAATDGNIAPHGFAHSVPSQHVPQFVAAETQRALVSQPPEVQPSAVSDGEIPRTTRPQDDVFSIAVTNRATALAADSAAPVERSNGPQPEQQVTNHRTASATADGLPTADRNLSEADNPVSHETLEALHPITPDLAASPKLPSLPASNERPTPTAVRPDVPDQLRDVAGTVGREADAAASLVRTPPAADRVANRSLERIGLPEDAVPESIGGERPVVRVTPQLAGLPSAGRQPLPPAVRPTPTDSGSVAVPIAAASIAAASIATGSIATGSIATTIGASTNPPIPASPLAAVPVQPAVNRPPAETEGSADTIELPERTRSPVSQAIDPLEFAPTADLRHVDTNPIGNLPGEWVEPVAPQVEPSSPLSGPSQAMHIAATATTQEANAATVSNRVTFAGDVAGSEAIARDIVDRARMYSGPGETRIELELDPPELGRIFVTLSETSDGISARVVVAHENVWRALEQSLIDFQSTLGDAGIDLHEFSLSQNESEAREEPADRPPRLDESNRTAPRQNAGSAPSRNQVDQRTSRRVIDIRA